MQVFSKPLRDRQHLHFQTSQHLEPFSFSIKMLFFCDLFLLALGLSDIHRQSQLRTDILEDRNLKYKNFLPHCIGLLELIFNLVFIENVQKILVQPWLLYLLILRQKFF